MGVDMDKGMMINVSATNGQKRDAILWPAYSLRTTHFTHTNTHIHEKRRAKGEEEAELAEA